MLFAVWSQNRSSPITLRVECQSRSRKTHPLPKNTPHLFRVLLLEKLQHPLLVTEATCEGCHGGLDVRGRHRAACSLSTRVKQRATPTERVLTNVCREASARVRFNASLRDMNVGVLSVHMMRLRFQEHMFAAFLKSLLSTLLGLSTMCLSIPYLCLRFGFVVAIPANTHRNEILRLAFDDFSVDNE